MTLFERYNKIKFKDHVMQSASDAAANAEMHDVVNAERALREAAEEEVRPFKEYVADAEAQAAAVAADAAAQRDAAATGAADADEAAG